MSKIYSVFMMIVVLCIPVLLATQDIDVSGDWEMTMETRRGERIRTLHFEQEGEKLTITMQGRQGQEISAEGTIQGDQIEWTVTRSAPRGEFTITYTGTVEGDTMSGEAQMGDFGSVEWTAERSQ